MTTETTKPLEEYSDEAKALALDVWRAGNRHGPDAERQMDILKVCAEYLEKARRDAHKAGFIEGFAK